LGDGELVGVTGALLRFDEYPKIHERKTMPRETWRYDGHR
jgi:hypothetical protein